MVDSVHVNAPASPNQEVRLVSVERDVAALKDGLTSLSNTVSVGFEKLGSKLENRTSTNWTAIGLIIGAILTVSGWGFALFGNFQSRTDATLVELKAGIKDASEKVDTTAAKFYPRDDLLEKLQALKERRDDAQRMTDSRIARIEHDLDADEKAITPHGELEARWAHQATVNEGLQRQLDRMGDQMDRAKRSGAQ